MPAGGRREGAGRPKKMDEEKLHRQMDDVKKMSEVWKKLAERVDKGDVQAIKLWASYRVGQPSTKLEVTGKNGTPFVAKINIV